MTDLRVAGCGLDAAKYAVMHWHWHYARAMPGGRTIRYGVWEDGQFVGVLIFGYGVKAGAGKPYGLTDVEIVDLERVALRPDHASTVTAVVSAGLRLLHDTNPGLRIVRSFADPEQGHDGRIYQAGNWIYTGRSARTQMWHVNGRWWHTRSIGAMKINRPASDLGWLDWLRETVDPYAEVATTPGKHRYLYPLDRAIRRRIAPLALPYPPACGRSVHGDTPGPRSGEAGSTPAVRSTQPHTRAKADR